MEFDTLFWQGMEDLIHTNRVIVDRPKGNPHPLHPELVYPLDYGYLENTTSGDGDGIDIWMGSLKSKTLTGILCTFDRIRSDAEIKLLIGCTNKDVQNIRNFHHEMLTLFIPNPLTDR